jgi:hypothetical protein
MVIGSRCGDYEVGGADDWPKLCPSPTEPQQPAQGDREANAEQEAGDEGGEKDGERFHGLV